MERGICPIIHLLFTVNEYGRKSIAVFYFASKRSFFNI